MTTVIDVGCARYGGDFSIERLIEEFSPEILYGFDPSWEPPMFDPPADLKTIVHISNEAVWTHDGVVQFTINGLNGQVTTTGPERPCVDLARVVRELPDDDIVLKVDAEGSEYELLEHLMAKGMDNRLRLAWIEWHPFGAKDWSQRRASIERRIQCELTEWRW